MKLYSNLLQCIPVVYIQDLSAIPDNSRIIDIWSCNFRRKWSNLTLSTDFFYVHSHSQWTEVDDNLPHHTPTLVHSIFIKRIRNFSVDIETCHVSVRDPSISLPLYKGKYKENFVPWYLYSYIIDFKSDWRLLISISNSSIYISIKWIASLVEKLVYTKQMLRKPL